MVGIHEFRIQLIYIIDILFFHSVEANRVKSKESRCFKEISWK